MRQLSVQKFPGSVEEAFRSFAGDRLSGASTMLEAAASAFSALSAHSEAKEGPALNNRMLLQNATDRYLVESIKRGRRGTSMPAFAESRPTHRLLSDGEVEDVVTFLRTWEKPS